MVYILEKIVEEIKLFSTAKLQKKSGLGEISSPIQQSTFVSVN